MGLSDSRAPVAIVGMAHRLPGPNGISPSSFELWQALLTGQDLVGEVDGRRWSHGPYLSTRRTEPGSTVTFAAGSVGDVSLFDSSFFGISPREAAEMDPQQRLLLEMTWEAFEDAGIAPSSVRGGRWATLVGLSSLDYAYRRADDLASFDASTMTGNAASIAANRISFAFDLRGPSLVVDTACSSSIVALHQACQSIRLGECDGAVVAGISLHLHPYGFVGFSKASMLSASGRCRPFDAAGDGYVRSEGGAVVLLKPLDRALADGDRVLALIVGSGVNADGHKNGLMVPSYEAQACLLRKVLAQAGINPNEIDYLEAHGTGTAVGDPIEARAIGEALGIARPRGRPLPIGSVKSNLGHLEAAAGMASLVKVLLTIRHRRIPPTIHFEHPNSHILFEDWNLVPVRETLELPAGKRLIVGINSFGFGGANAHALLTSFEGTPTLAEGVDDVGSSFLPAQAPLLLSARSPKALQAMAGAFARHVRESKECPLYDLAWSAAFRRETHAHRLISIAREREELTANLERFAEQGVAPKVFTGHLVPGASAPVFVYSGNGSQWAGMGKRLLELDGEFRSAVEEVDALLAQRVGFSIIEEMCAPASTSRLEYTEVAQPALFAIQAGLTRSLRARGVIPAAVCGHSVGEVAAAWACGALTLPSAAALVVERSRQQARTKGAGQMSAVALGERPLQELIESLELTQHLVIAGINSARSTTIAGTVASLDAIESVLSKRRVVFKRLALDYAFHGPAMDPIREDLLHHLTDLAPIAGDTPFYSSVTGMFLGGESLDADYWWRNVRDPVRFASAVEAMVCAGLNVFVEIGPDSILRNYLSECVADVSRRDAGLHGFVLPTMQRNDARADPVGRAFYDLWLAGARVDTSKVFPRRGRFVDLPHYPWQRERHWHPETSESLGLLSRRIVHPLLGYAIAGSDFVWESHLDTVRLPWLADHVVSGSTVFPAAGFAEMALAAGRERSPQGQPSLEDLEILSPMVLAKERSRTTRIQIDQSDGRFTITSRERLSTDAWVTHATGRLVENAFHPALPVFALPATPAHADAERHYGLAKEMGLHYGPTFRAVSELWVEGASVIGRLATPAGVRPDVTKLVLHPVSLDGALQLLADLLPMQPGVDTDLPAFLPVRIGRVQVLEAGCEATAARATLLRRGPRSIVADFVLFNASGQPVALAHEVRFRAVARRRAPLRSRALAMHTVPAPRPDPLRRSELPPVHGFATLCARRLHDVRRAPGREQYAAEVEPLLDMLCAAFAERSLRTLVSSSKALDPSHLLATGVVAPDAESLLLRSLQMLEEQGAIARSGQRWLLPEESQLPLPEEIWSSLILDYPQFGSLTGHVGSAGLRLASRLRTGSAGRAAKPFDGLWAETCTRGEAASILGAIVDAVLHALEANAEGARLRVLCCLTKDALKQFGRLCRRLDFDRCDLLLAVQDSAAAEEARALLLDAPQIVPCLAQLDSDAPDVPQVLGGVFDLVVFGEGLALAPDVQRRVANAGRLLAQGGLILLLEQQPSRALDFLHGFDPRWWDGVALEGVVRSRLRPARFWCDLLERSGFSDAQAVHDLPAEAGSAAAQIGPCLVIARKRPGLAAEQSQTPPVARCWILFQDETGYSVELASELEHELATLGQKTITVMAAAKFTSFGERRFSLDPTNVQDWTRLLEVLQQAGETPDGWVHLAGLDPTSASLPTHSRLALQETRTAALLAWLRGCSGAQLAPESWVVAAHTSLLALPKSVRARQLEADPLRDSSLLGATRVAVNEFPEQHIRWIDLADPSPGVLNAPRIAREILEPDEHDEICLASEGRYAPRAVEVPLEPSRPALQVPSGFRLELPLAASLRNLAWRRFELTAPGPGEVEIEVRAAGLNFRDVMYAMGLLPDEALESGFSGPTLGMELSGFITRVGEGVQDLAPGDAALAFAPAAFANRVLTKATAVVPKPPQWSFEAAATVPTAFFTAYYALRELARLREGERILIHGAAGGVGIAAIQIARHLGAEVFATAGSPQKRDFVRLLGAARVFDSRSLAFADEILQATGGEGVDVVLNSIAGEAVRRNLAILRPFGRLLELGKRDFYENTRLGLRPFRHNISYFGIDADQLMVERPNLARRLFLELLGHFADGVLRPLPFEAFDATEIESAFACMRDSRQIGKIVVTFDAEFDPTPPDSRAVVPITLLEDATYLVTGGLSGFGLRTAQWLVARGARHLALLSRRGAETPDATEALAEFTARGVSAKAFACDVANEGMLTEALSRMRSEMPPLHGIFHAAMVMEDAFIRDCDREALHRVLAPKAVGAANLDRLTREDPLDFFVLYSSATTLFGNPGQAKYVAANCALEALASERRAAGLPATCVLWGPIADAGYLASNESVRSALAAHLGAPGLNAEEALNVLDRLLAPGSAAASANLAILDVNWGTLARHLPGARSPRFAELVRRAGREGSRLSESADLREWLSSLASDELEDAIAGLLAKEIGAILRIAPERIDPTVSLYEIGMDSLMGLELALALDARLGVRLPETALAETPTVERLAQRLARMLHPEQAQAATEDIVAPNVRVLAAQHATEVAEGSLAEFSAALRAGTVPETGSLTGRDVTEGDEAP